MKADRASAGASALPLMRTFPATGVAGNRGADFVAIINAQIATRLARLKPQGLMNEKDDPFNS
jgi:hypothetical protein